MWDEVNLDSIQGVCVDDSIGTSISSVSRVYGTSNQSLSQNLEVTPSFFQPREHSMPKAARQIGCSSKYATHEHFESSIDSTQFIFSCDFFAK